jgi:WD40 repeat protein
MALQGRAPGLRRGQFAAIPLLLSTKVGNGQVVRTLRGHTSTIIGLDFSPTEAILASSAWDGTIRLWDVATGACLRNLCAPRPYDGMNIAGVTGISDAQKAALKALGAVAEDSLIGTATATL